MISMFLLTLWSFGLESSATQIFNVNEEANLYTTLSVLKLSCCGIIMFISSRKYASRPMLLLALFFAAAAIDENSQIHERLGLLFSTGIGAQIFNFQSSYDWLFYVAPPLILIIIVLLVIIIKSTIDPFSRTWIVAGVSIMVIGAVGLELIPLVTPLYSVGVNNFSVFLIFEEGIEAVGASMLVAECLRVTRFDGFQLNRSFPRWVKVLTLTLSAVVISVSVVTLEIEVSRNQFAKIGNSEKWEACKLPGHDRTVLDNCSVKSSTRIPHFLTFGPYVSLPKGSFVAEFAYSSTEEESQEVGEIDVTTDGGVSTLTKKVVERSMGGKFISRVSFNLTEDCYSCEIRFKSYGTAPIWVDYLYLKRVS